MSTSLGLLALALLGAEPLRKPDAPQITFQMHVYEMKGVGWRASVQGRLHAVTRQANSSVWTVSCARAHDLAKAADTVIQAPA